MKSVFPIFYMCLGRVKEQPLTSLRICNGKGAVFLGLIWTVRNHPWLCWKRWYTFGIWYTKEALNRPNPMTLTIIGQRDRRKVEWEMQQNWESKMLTGVKVLELTRGSSGAYAGRLFACSGAKVTKGIKKSQSISAFTEEEKNLIYVNDRMLNGEGIHSLLSESSDIILWDSHTNDELDQYLMEYHTDRRDGSASIRVDFPEGINADEEQALQAMGGWMELTGSPESSP